MAVETFVLERQHGAPPGGWGDGRPVGLAVMSSQGEQREERLPHWSAVRCRLRPYDDNPAVAQSVFRNH
jgi:hypothetical protein